MSKHLKTLKKESCEYTPPAITYTGALTQFTGSPLSKPLSNNPLNLPNQ